MFKSGLTEDEKKELIEIKTHMKQLKKDIRSLDKNRKGDYLYRNDRYMLATQLVRLKNFYRDQIINGKKKAKQNRKQKKKDFKINLISRIKNVRK